MALAWSKRSLAKIRLHCWPPFIFHQVSRYNVYKHWGAETAQCELEIILNNASFDGCYYPFVIYVNAVDRFL